MAEIIKVRTEVVGLKETLDALETIGDQKEINKILQEANKQAFNISNTVAQYKTLPFSERLLSTVKIAAGRAKNSKNAKIVGPTMESYILRFLNSGTKERYVKSGRYKGAYRGKIIGSKAINTFAEEEGLQILDKALERYDELILNAVKKRIKKYNKKK